MPILIVMHSKLYKYYHYLNYDYMGTIGVNINVEEI